MEEHQPAFTATGSGGMGIDDTTLTVHHSISGRYQDNHTKFSCSCGGARTSGETQLFRKSKAEKL